MGDMRAQLAAYGAPGLAGLMLVTGLALQVSQSLRDFGGPVATVEHCLGLYGRAEIDTLLAESHCGSLTGSAEQRIELLGEAEFVAVRQIYLAALQKGRARYDEGLQTVQKLGKAQFDELERRERRQIRQQGFVRYLAETGFPLADAKTRTTVHSVDMILNGTGLQPHVLHLGRAQLPAEEAARLPANKTLEQFVQGRDDFITKRGKELLRGSALLVGGLEWSAEADWEGSQLGTTLYRHSRVAVMLEPVTPVPQQAKGHIEAQYGVYYDDDGGDWVMH